MKLILIVLFFVTAAVGQNSHEKRLEESATVLSEVMDIADKAIPQG